MIRQEVQRWTAPIKRQPHEEVPNFNKGRVDPKPRVERHESRGKPHGMASNDPSAKAAVSDDTKAKEAQCCLIGQNRVKGSLALPPRMTSTWSPRTRQRVPTTAMSTWRRRLPNAAMSNDMQAEGAHAAVSNDMNTTDRWWSRATWLCSAPVFIFSTSFCT